MIFFLIAATFLVLEYYCGIMTGYRQIVKNNGTFSLVLAIYRLYNSKLRIVCNHKWFDLLIVSVEGYKLWKCAFNELIKTYHLIQVNTW
jgi:hypothetical protein